MNTTHRMMVVGAVALGAATSVGCNDNRAPLTPTGVAAVAGATSSGKAGTVVLEPGRPHDVSNADIAGTVQFRIASGPAGDLEGLLGPAIYYEDGNGQKIPAQFEVSVIKGTASRLVTVRSGKPLERGAWYRLRVATGSGVAVSDSGRTGADRLWGMRLFTGPNPQVVAISEKGSRIHVSFSEPINLKDVDLSITSGGKAVAGCFETPDGCVAHVSAPSVFAEEVSFKLTNAANPQALEVRTRGAGLAPVQLKQGNWKIGSDGALAWLHPMTVD